MRARIRKTLSLRLGLTMAGVALAAVALVALLIAAAGPTEFERFLLDQGQRDYSETATRYYEQNGSWEDVEQILAPMGPVVGPAVPGEPSAIHPPPMILVDPSGVVLAGGPEYSIGSRIDLAAQSQSLAIVVDGEEVGYVVGTGFAATQDELTAAYLRRINQRLLVSAIIAGLASLVLGLLLSRSITRPVRRLTTASRAMARGELGQVVHVRSQDEIAELADAFNRMNADLQRASQARRQMTADIAHELRTPLTVMAGYTEAMRDGVLEPTPERFAMMHDETVHLQQLVADLRTLSIAEAGEMSLTLQPLDPHALLSRIATLFAHQAEQSGVVLTVEAAQELPVVAVDEERMAQVLSNLVSNALRYTPESGTITLGARREANGVALTVTDTGNGIAAEMLPHVFDRFYKGDASRSAEGGQTGLGLAIARALVQAHDGRISAESEGERLGSVFTVWLPAA